MLTSTGDGSEQLATRPAGQEECDLTAGQDNLTKTKYLPSLRIEPRLAQLLPITGYIDFSI
jgi:hypothetical protein